MKTRLLSPAHEKPDLEWTWQLPLELAAAAGWKPTPEEIEAIKGPLPDNSEANATESAKMLADKNAIDLSIIPIPEGREAQVVNRVDVAKWISENPLKPPSIEECAEDAAKLITLIINEVHNASVLAVKRTRGFAMLVNLKLLRPENQRPTVRARWRTNSKNTSRLLAHQDPRFHRVTNLTSRD